MATNKLHYIHHFEQASTPGLPTLLLLHGTGGDEQDLLSLGRMLAPGAALLSPRGNVLEQGMPRFFRRIAEGVFDIEDLHKRTGELKTFIEEASAEYEIDPKKIVAVGFSNGANIAASLLLSYPDVLAGGALLHPRVPFQPEEKIDLKSKPIFIGAGRTDMLAPERETIALQKILKDARADVTVAWQNGGHSIGIEEVRAAQNWMRQRHFA